MVAPLRVGVRPSNRLRLTPTAIAKILRQRAAHLNESHHRSCCCVMVGTLGDLAVKQRALAQREVEPVAWLALMDDDALQARRSPALVVHRDDVRGPRRHIQGVPSILFSSRGGEAAYQCRWTAHEL